MTDASSPPKSNTQRLYRTSQGTCVQLGTEHWALTETEWDDLFNSRDLPGKLESVGDFAGAVRVDAPTIGEMRAPVGHQEVWAAGVTYLRSRSARIAESAESGGSNYYDRVYAANRPELFFKSTPHRVSGHGQAVRIRADSRWSVPEPEVAVAINSLGEVVGYTIGNDMSARDIEGENPLYLPQAKVYDGCCALGPSILITNEGLAKETEISLSISRNDSTGNSSSIVFEGATSLASMKRTIEELIGFLFRDNSFPNGVFLLTGTGIVPPDAFALCRGDRIDIRIDAIGTLTNFVVQV